MRFAIVGCGQIAATHARALLGMPETAELVACSDVIPSRAEAFASSFGIAPQSYEAIIGDPSIDAISVCTPSGLHAEVGAPALLAGKHVIVEKPMDISTQACDVLLRAQASSGTTLGVVSQRRFNTAARRVKAAVDSGVFGEIIMADCRVPWFRSQEYYDSGDWRGTWGLDGGGCLMNQGLHTVDLMRWICGPVTSAYAEARTAAHVRLEVEDVICATLTFANGAIGTLMASTSSYPAYAARLAVQGTRGGAVIEGDSLAAFATTDGVSLPVEPPRADAIMCASGGTRAAATSATQEPVPAVGLDEWTRAHQLQLIDFIQAARLGQTPLVDGQEGRNAVEVIEAIYGSARDGRRVTV